MTRRYITKPQFDIHAEPIDDLANGRTWVASAVAQHRADHDEPEDGAVDMLAAPHPPMPAPRAEVEPYQDRESRTTSLLVVLGIGILLMLGFAVWMFTGWMGEQ